MKHILNIKTLISAVVITLLLSSCEKFLDEKPRKSYQVAEKLSDFQAILDYYPSLNNKEIFEMEISADNYYLTDEHYTALTQITDRRLYTWEKDQLFPLLTNNWLDTYYAVYNANVVLDGLEKINPVEDMNTWKNVKGQALVFRAKSFLQIVSAWSLAYDPGTAQTDMGIPLRLNSNFNEFVPRSSVQQAFDQINSDLKEAVPLLPVVSSTLMRPSRPAAYAFLARTYLYMRDYAQAEKYADSALQLNDKLLDYNSLNAAANYPISRLNVEVLFENYGNAAPLLQSRAKINPVLYSSYDANDLRKTVFFKNNNNGSFAFKGSYEGGSQQFTGLATNEIYLIRAESKARNGNPEGAMSDLNTLLIKRFRTGTYIPYSVQTKEDAVNIILTERRKELLFRNLRWTDIKRLNKEGADITLSKTVNGITYTLPPNDLRYALPLPEDLIVQWGYRQNSR